MKILCDLDGVLVDFVSGYFSLIGKNNLLPIWKPGLWDLEAGCGVKMDEDLLTREFWGQLPWMSDGKKILHTLEREFGSPNVCILSSCHVKRVGDACAGKFDWIGKNITAYRDRYLFGPNKTFCSHRDSILVDDKDENVIQFRAEGGRAILIPRIWNSAHRHRDLDIPTYLLGQIDALRP